MKAIVKGYPKDKPIIDETEMFLGIYHGINDEMNGEPVLVFPQKQLIIILGKNDFWSSQESYQLVIKEITRLDPSQSVELRNES